MMNILKERKIRLHSVFLEWQPRNCMRSQDRQRTIWRDENGTFAEARWQDGMCSHRTQGSGKGWQRPYFCFTLAMMNDGNG